MKNEMLYLIAQMLRVDLINEVQVTDSSLRIKLGNDYVELTVNKI